MTKLSRRKKQSKGRQSIKKILKLQKTLNIVIFFLDGSTLNCQSRSYHFSKESLI
jgi:hypothetical protein